MRESIGNTWLFSLILTFIFLFTCFLCLALSYSKAFSLKNEILSITEKYEGITDSSHTIINNYLLSNNYNTMGTCPIDNNRPFYGENDLNNTGALEEAQSGVKYYYCVQPIRENNKLYYKLKLFYNFNLPIVGDIATFDISGKTTNVYDSMDIQLLMKG